MKQSNSKFTYEHYLLLSDENRYEILEGDLCMVPAPEVYHQRVSRKLEVALIEHVERYDLGEILHAPCDVVLSRENIVQPDVLFVSKDRLGIIRKAQQPHTPGAGVRMR